MSTAVPAAPRPSRTERAIQITILLLVAGMAGAASFTHVHDWTMQNSPDKTPHGFGWSNAIISELLPIAALLEVRRRRALGLPFGYPLTVVMGSALLSLTAQVSQAKPTMFGWLVAALPALALLVLVKMVLSRTTPAVPAAVPSAVPDAPVLTVPAVQSTESPAVPAAVLAPAPAPAPLLPVAPVPVPPAAPVRSAPAAAYPVPA